MDTMYLTYDEYLELGGNEDLDEMAFGDLEFEARSYIDWYTFNRLEKETEIPDKVKRCMYHIIKLIQMKLNYMNDGTEDGALTGTSATQISSQSNDGVSISYNVITANEALQLAKTDIDKSIKRYLQGVTNSLGRKLLYRGVYPDE